jgi:hypothetical protein
VANSQGEHWSCTVAYGILRQSWELQLLLGGIDHCSCIAAERQLEGDMHSFVAAMGIQSCLRIQEEGLLEHRDEEDGEGEEGLEQR